nr:hypothetical protein [Tanacetum cinerariifolium]
MASLADKAILSGAENRPPMLEEDMYDSWRSRMELFSLLLNDMNMYNMKLEQFQVNTKFLNALPPEWSKFVTDVKLQQASPYQPSPYTTTYHTPQFVSQGSSSSNLSISYPMNDTLSTVNHNAYIASAPQIDYALIAHHPLEFSSPETGHVVLVFQKGDDPIDAINHMMSFLTSVVTSCSSRTLRMFIEQSHDEVYGYLKGGSGNSRGKRLAISKVKEAWLSKKKE